MYQRHLNKNRSKGPFKSEEDCKIIFCVFHCLWRMNRINSGIEVSSSEDDSSNSDSDCNLSFENEEHLKDDQICSDNIDEDSSAMKPIEKTSANNENLQRFSISDEANANLLVQCLRLEEAKDLSSKDWNKICKSLDRSRLSVRNRFFGILFPIIRKFLEGKIARDQYEFFVCFLT